jgi:RNA polymerase sigma factor (sigma-70 family)
LVEEYAWTLLTVEELVGMVSKDLPPEQTLDPSQLERHVRHCYIQVLYKACRQAEDMARREQGYRELFRYLFRAASNRWPDCAEDVTQRALVLVYEQIERCRDPGTFLAFALYKLRHAFQQEIRARGAANPLADVSYQRTARRSAMPQSSLEREERLRELMDAVRDLSDLRQQQTIVLKFLGGLSDAEISERLGITVGYVRVLRHRGLKHLRADAGLRQYFDVDDDAPVRKRKICNVWAPNAS